MTLGDDIKEVFSEIGTAVTIYKPAGVVVTGEYIRHKVNSRSSDPFHREFFIDSELPYDTSIDASNVIAFNQTGQRYIAMTKTPEIFENGISLFRSVLYKCNVSGELSRPSGEIVEYAHHTENVFSLIEDACYGLLTESNYGNELLRTPDYGDAEKRQLFLFTPSSNGVQSGDRYTPVSGENYQVGVVKSRIYENTDVAILYEDNR